MIFDRTVEIEVEYLDVNTLKGKKGGELFSFVLDIKSKCVCVYINGVKAVAQHLYSLNKADNIRK